jgi:hypothetical protein
MGHAEKDGVVSMEEMGYICIATDDMQNYKEIAIE